jgi:hypothetical protein
MAEADAKKRKRTGATRTKSAIAKPAKKQANESPARTRVAGKRTVVAPDTYNPQKLSEKHAEAKQLAKQEAAKSKKAPAKKRASKA